ncbi:MAG: hypothetical protein B7Y83_03830 [Flavobacteriales bacterium 32-34-25]|nr:MAG: hypothetical protein B7Y83_03830 [Flavobacteriales bacterium 32-34-25]
MKLTFTFIKMRFTFFAVSFFLFTHFSNAQTYNWVGGVSTDFYNANNWDDTSLTFSDLQSYTFVIGAGTPNNLIHVGGSASDITKRPGRFNTTASANVILKGNLIPWNSDYLNGTITLESPASINIRSNIYLGKGTNATLNVSGGTLNNRYALYIGNALNGNGTANIAGGTVYVETNLEVGTGTGNPTGNLNITGGTVDVKTAINIGTNGHVFISGIGQLVVTGDKKTTLEDYIANGKITCPSGQSLAVVYNGTRTSVTISQDPNRMIQEFTDYIILKNGVLEARINKSSSDIRSLKVNGVETLYQSSTNPRSGTYYDLTSSAGFEKIGGASFSIKEETADYIDVSFSRPYIAGVTATPVDVEIHYVLKKADAGLYTYSILRHKAAYPTFDLGSWRQVLWIDNTVTDKICVNDLKTWEMPQPGDTWEPTAIAEIIKITSGVRAGKYDGKYQFSENLIGLKAYGHSSDKNNLGIWAVMGNHEYFNGGPMRRDLNSAAGIIHVCMNGVHYNDKGFVINQGEEWSKIYGPYLMYANQKATAAENWADAKARAAKDETEWPFSWLTNTPEYPLAAGRGNITGKFSISDPSKPEINGGDAWIGVTQLSSDSGGNWQFEEENYQYWVKTDASGNFNIKNVRPGTYTLFAYKDGTTGEYRQETVVVTAAGTTNLGNINWAIPRTNGKIVFEIGVPNRTAEEYKFGDFDYCEGFVEKKFPTTFTNPIEYNVDDKNWKTVLPYVHSSYFDANGNRSLWEWNINFTLTGTIPTTGNAKLTIAYASSDHAQNWIFVNGNASGNRITPSSGYYPPNGGGNAFLRQSNHAKYGLATFDIPYSKLKAGLNTLKLQMPSTSNGANHVMYDYISLEGDLTSTFNAVDTDNDGVVDSLDLCPNTPTGESVYASGCSQSQLDDDNDGVKNNLDLCSNTLTGETVNTSGCSNGQLDDDNDGVKNSLDTCANTPTGESVNASGCSQSQLDDDNDGVKNNLDLCSNTPTGETVNTSGCSNGQLDDDNDGVKNSLDTCVNTPTGESVNASGCSQSQLDDDNDGVKNNIDKCANTPTGETVNADGCAPSQLDDDKDGVNNNIDLCPNTKLGTSVDTNGCFVLSSDNFTIQAIGESCVGKKNGKITITAKNVMDYSTVINGVTYNFTTSKTVVDLAPGTYDFCISVVGESFNQCYSVAVESGANISARTTVVSDKLSVDINQGTAPYTVLVNGKTVLETNAMSFSVDVIPGDLVQVQTGLACEGTINTKIDLAQVVAYPNPSKGLFDIALPITLDRVKIELMDSKGQLISSEKYQVSNGKVHMNIEDKAVGVYFVKVYLDEVVILKIIKE